MELTVLAPIDVEDIKEKDVQTAFERNLGLLEEGLEFVATEVVIGTGRIDTLAYDRDNTRAVFIEYKGPGGFGKNALIQLMDYLSWFVRDENRLLVLDQIVRKSKPGIPTLNSDIALICVVADVEDRIRNAIYALANDVKVYTYRIAKDTAGKLVLFPKLEVDNSVIEKVISTGVPEDELLSRHAQLAPLFRELRPHLEKDGTSVYTLSKTFRAKKKRVFAEVYFQQGVIRLALRTGRGAFVDPDFKYQQGEPDWGHVKLYASVPIPEKVIGWIDLARSFASQPGSEIEEGEEVAP